jgi:hypothetical protein
LPRTGRPYSGDTLPGGHVKPVALKMKLPKIGWHTFRHSYQSWLGSTDAELSEMKDMIAAKVEQHLMA